jgi:hypothetical protein
MLSFFFHGLHYLTFRSNLSLKIVDVAPYLSNILLDSAGEKANRLSKMSDCLLRVCVHHSFCTLTG